MKMYALISQMLLEVFVLIIIGYFIGNKIDSDGILKGVLAIVGGLLGLIFMILQVITIERKKNKN